MGQYDWGVGCNVSINNNYSATQTSITVRTYFINVGWNYQIGIKAWTALNGSWTELNVQGIDTRYDEHGHETTSGWFLAGSKTYIVDKGYSSYTVTGQGCIKDTSGNSYAGGYQRYSDTITVTVSAKSSYSVTYNANGGTGAPSAQTKWNGEDLVLSSTVPTRKGYIFKGWGTSATTGTVEYESGATYTSNAALSLYAIWEKRGTMHILVNGEWRDAIPYVLINGEWKQAMAYIKNNNDWKMGI